MPRIALPEGVSIHCAVDDFLWPWDRSTPVLMMHGFARNATFWNRWVPAIGESHRVYRPDLLGCGHPTSRRRHIATRLTKNPGGA